MKSAVATMSGVSTVKEVKGGSAFGAGWERLGLHKIARGRKPRSRLSEAGAASFPPPARRLARPSPMN